MRPTTLLTTATILLLIVLGEFTLAIAVFLVELLIGDRDGRSPLTEDVEDLEDLNPASPLTRQGGLPGSERS